LSGGSPTGLIAQPAALAPVLMIVAKAVTVLLTTAERLDGKIAASSCEVGGVLLGVKVAETFCAALIVTMQVPTPLHAPLQPAKAKPLAGVIDRLTTVLLR